MADEQSDVAASGPEGGLSRGDLQNRAIRGASWTVIHTVVSLPLAFLVNIVLARTLGVVDYGRLAYLTTVMGIAGGIISLGTGSGLIQFGAKAHAAGDAASVQRLLSSIQGFRLFVTAPVMSLLVLVIASVSTPMLVIAVVFGVLVPATFSTAADCLGIENKTAAGAKVNMAVNVVLQIAVASVAVTIATADAVWATRMVIGQLGIGFLCLIFVAPEYRRAVLRPRWPRGLPQGFWRFALPIGAAGVIGTLVVSRSEVVVLSWMSQPEAAGVFAMAFGLAGHIFAPAQALIGPLIPAVSGLREVDEAAVGRAFLRSLRGVSTIVGLLVAGALPAFAALVPSIYGDQYSQVSDVMLWLGLAGALLVVAGPVQAFVQARLSGWRVLIVNIVALIVDIVLMVSLIPNLGVWGAVIANVAASIIQLIALLSGELRAQALSWGRVLRNSLPVLIGGAACASAWGLVSVLALHPIPAALLAGSIGLAVFLGGIRALRSGLEGADADAIAQALPARVRPVVGVLLSACTAKGAAE